MEKNRITSSELLSILDMLISSDEEIKIIAIELLNTYDWSGLLNTELELFWMTLRLSIFTRNEELRFLPTSTYTSFLDGRLCKIIKEWKDSKEK